MVCNIFTELYNYHQNLILHLFLIPKRNPAPISIIAQPPLTSPDPGKHKLLSVYRFVYSGHFMVIKIIMYVYIYFFK